MTVRLVWLGTGELIYSCDKHLPALKRDGARVGGVGSSFDKCDSCEGELEDHYDNLETDRRMEEE